MNHLRTDIRLEEVYHIIGDSKVRELQKEMERKEPNRSPGRILHFSDGTLNTDDLDDDEAEEQESGGAVVDSVSL